jgi:spore germination protein GerM
MTGNKKIFAIIIAAIAILALWFFVRFVIGGPEDTWICVDGRWIKHGVPSAPMPAEPCGEKSQAERAVKLYYYNLNLDKDESGNTACSRNGLVAVERKIPITKTPIQDTIKLLLSGGLTDEERAKGISTEYPLEGLSLKGASLKDGVLTLEFDDPNNKTVGGSCRVGILWFQIEATAKQLPEVRQVHFLPEELFQP